MLIFKRYMAFVVFSFDLSKDSCPLEANDMVVHEEMGCCKILPTAFSTQHHEN